MLSVCITHWSTVMSLLLVMSTLPSSLLPTVQSSVVHDIVRQMLLQPSSNSSIITPNRTTTLSTGLRAQSYLVDRQHSSMVRNHPGHHHNRLGKSSYYNEPKEKENCFINDADANLTYAACYAAQFDWLELLKETDASPQEYWCKALYCDYYCINLVARTFCSSADYATTNGLLTQIISDANANATYGYCRQFSSWLPPMNSPPFTPYDFMECAKDILNKKAQLEQCVAGATNKIIQDKLTSHTEAQCKFEYEKQKCIIKFACMACDREFVDEYLNFTAIIWSPMKVECTEWARDEPQMECLDEDGDECRSKVEEAQDGEQDALAVVQLWNTLSENAQERQCKTIYYIVYILNQMACAVCTAGDQLRSYQAYLSKTLDYYHADCVQYRSWLPKLKCISNTSAHEHELAKCVSSLSRHNANQSCLEQIPQKFDGQHLQEGSKERVCKLAYFMQKCLFQKMACKFCDNVEDVHGYMKQVWDPTKAECTEWVSEAPAYKCPATYIWWIVGGVVLVLVVILLIVLVVVIVCCTCRDGNESGSSSSRGHHHGGRGHGHGQPVGEMQPIGTVQQVGANQQVGTIPSVGTMPQVGTMQPIQGHGQSAGASMQPVGTMQPIQV